MYGSFNTKIPNEAPDWRLRSAKQHARKPLHTTSQDIVPYVVKKKKSKPCAPEDGQKFAQNMLS
jgi:hypothetical protein